MTTEITSTTYENGKRVETQRITYEKSDDLYSLANVQRRYENICKQIKENGETENLLAEKARVQAEVEAWEKIVAGYESKEE